MAFEDIKYSVFLTFRGADVRKSLIDHLYQSLVAAGIPTFLDSEELEKGDHIESSLEKAIVESEIYIPIFSTNFAQSAWCLQELSLMCSHISTPNSTHKMVPLFYKVEPSHVRYADGENSPYAKYFRDHSTKGRHTTDTISQWKNALKQASNLFGFTLEDASGYEGKLVKQVLMDILNKLNKGSLDVAKQPVGLTARMNKLKDLLKCGDPDDKSVRTVGIWGMGGIGKTTLSEAVFNEIKSMFDAFCFVSDVRERANESSKGLRKLQKQILKGLLKIEFEVNSVDEGKMILREHLGSTRALLILDDVDDKKQLDALHGDQWFGGGSRVIITTRDKHILNLAQADEIYEAEELEHNQALELFSWHAFLRVCPDEGYEDLSERVVKACKGLPLSLEVMGAHLYDKKDNSIFWDEALSRIESVMDQDLYKTLKISFNGLHEEEKQIFLDIACFFLGERNEPAIEIWKAIGCKNPHTVITNLFMKSLIRAKFKAFAMNEFGRFVGLCPHFTMHDHLRDLGREIVAEESREDPCKRSRLWHPHDVRRVLRESEGISNLRGFKCCDYEIVVPMESLALIKNMQFLWVENVQLVRQETTQFPPKLKCLDCRIVVMFWNFLLFRKGWAWFPEIFNRIGVRALLGAYRIATFNKRAHPKLDLQGCKNVRGLAGMEALKYLKRLIVRESTVSQINVRQWIEGLSGLQVLCLSANRIPEWLTLRLHRMLKPEERGLGEYCVLEDVKCTRIVLCCPSDAFRRKDETVVNICTGDDEILREFTLPILKRPDDLYHDSFVDDDEYSVGIVQEELPSIIKFRSGDIIRYSTDAEIVGVYMEVLDLNESGNDDVDIQFNQSLAWTIVLLNAHE
eukprot:Gb_12752 [translate_table: standard]